MALVLKNVTPRDLLKNTKIPEGEIINSDQKTIYAILTGNTRQHAEFTHGKKPVLGFPGWLVDRDQNPDKGSPNILKRLGDFLGRDVSEKILRETGFSIIPNSVRDLSGKETLTYSAGSTDATAKILYGEVTAESVKSQLENAKDVQYDNQTGAISFAKSGNTDGGVINRIYLVPEKKAHQFLQTNAEQRMTELSTYAVLNYLDNLIRV
jgi:ABC-type amino acid transport substrate-binding protein